MSSVILDQLSGPFLETKPYSLELNRTEKYGIKANVGFTVSGRNDDNYERRGAVFTNVVTPFGGIDFKVVDDLRINDGFNVKLVNDYGSLDERLVMESMRQSGWARPLEAANFAEQATMVTAENHVGVLFNLLRLYVWKCSDFDKYRVKNQDEYYNDGHVSQSYMEHFGNSFNEECEVQLNVMAPSTWSETVVLGQGDYMPSVKLMTVKELSILSAAVGGWRCDYPLRIMSSCPALCTRFIIADNRASQVDFLEQDEISAQEVLMTLKKLVSANRIESQFDLAYWMLCQAMYLPMPRSIEANAWVSPLGTMYLPRAGSTRGLFKELTGGQAYNSRPSSYLTWSNFKMNPTRLIIHAIAMCEAVFTGLFEVMTRENTDLLTCIEGMGVDGSVNMNPHRIILECAGYRFGKVLESSWNTSVGMDFAKNLFGVDKVPQRELNVHVEGDTSGYEIIEQVLQGRKYYRVRAKTAKPVMFPVLSYGVNDDRYYLNSMRYGTTMYKMTHRQGYYMRGHKDASKAMAILRMGGFDATVIDTATRRQYRNWAANSNGHVMPIHPSNTDETSAFVLDGASLSRRRKSWIDVDLNADRLDLKVNIAIKGYVMFRSGTETLAMMTTYKPVVTPPKAMTDGEMAAVVMNTTGKSAPYMYSDFMLAMDAPQEEPQILPSGPVGTDRSQYIEEYPETGISQEEIEQV